VSVFVNSVFAFGLDVPDLDLVITSSGEDLSAISGEGNREDISGVTNKLGDGSSGGNVPETDGTIPRSGEAESSVNGQADFVNEVRVTGEHLSGLSPFDFFFVTLIFINSPLDESLITRSGKEEFNLFSVLFFFTNSEGSNPTTVTYKNNKVRKTRSLL
jgi:hypothetical protein